MEGKNGNKINKNRSIMTFANCDYDLSLLYGSLLLIYLLTYLQLELYIIKDKVDGLILS